MEFWFLYSKYNLSVLRPALTFAECPQKMSCDRRFGTDEIFHEPVVKYNDLKMASVYLPAPGGGV